MANTPRARLFAHRCLPHFSGWHQVDEERKEAEAIKERVAKDEAAVATRQEEVLHQCLNERVTLQNLRIPQRDRS